MKANINAKVKVVDFEEVVMSRFQDVFPQVIKHYLKEIGIHKKKMSDEKMFNIVMNGDNEMLGGFAIFIGKQLSAQVVMNECKAEEVEN